MLLSIEASSLIAFSAYSPLDQVEYLIKVCKAAQAYASTQAPKLSKVRDGQHMINQLRDVTSDLGRQHDKILAVYEAREVRRSADRLGETLNGVYDLLGDVEDVAVMFGRKKGFGKRVSALVHDIGTHANSLLAATSLAIADRCVGIKVGEEQNVCSTLL